MKKQTILLIIALILIIIIGCVIIKLYNENKTLNSSENQTAAQELNNNQIKANDLTSIVNSYFEEKVEEGTLEKSGVQAKTLESIIKAGKENADQYSVLLKPELYIGGDGTEYILINSNYEQYDFIGWDNQTIRQ